MSKQIANKILFAFGPALIGTDLQLDYAILAALFSLLPERIPDRYAVWKKRCSRLVLMSFLWYILSPTLAYPLYSGGIMTICRLMDLILLGCVLHALRAYCYGTLSKYGRKILFQHYLPLVSIFTEGDPWEWKRLWLWCVGTGALAVVLHVISVILPKAVLLING